MMEHPAVIVASVVNGPPESERCRMKLACPIVGSIQLRSTCAEETASIFSPVGASIDPSTLATSPLPGSSTTSAPVTGSRAAAAELPLPIEAELHVFPLSEASRISPA